MAARLFRICSRPASRRRLDRSQTTTKSSAEQMLSGLPPKGEQVNRLLANQKRTHASQQKVSLFDHLVGAGNELPWHVDPESQRGLEIDYQLHPRHLLDRQVARLFAPEDTTRI